MDNSDGPGTTFTSFGKGLEKPHDPEIQERCKYFQEYLKGLKNSSVEHGTFHIEFLTRSLQL